MTEPLAARAATLVAAALGAAGAVLLALTLQYGHDVMMGDVGGVVGLGPLGASVAGYVAGGGLLVLADRLHRRHGVDLGHGGR